MLQRTSLILCVLITMHVGNAARSSQVLYEPTPQQIATGMDRFRCKGNFGEATSLKDIGYSDEDALKGVMCKKGDFKGDGSAAYWIYKCDALSLCQSKVLFMEDGKVNKSIKLKVMDLPDVFYHDDQKSDVSRLLKKYHCPIPKTDALVEIGDGDGLENRVYQFNSHKDNFEQIGSCTTIED